MFLSQNLDELNLNSGFEIEQLTKDRHANDASLVSNKEINKDDSTTIDYYAKTFSKDSRHTGYRLIDSHEALVYKSLEDTGFRPKCCFLLKSDSSSMVTTSADNFIVTENLAKALEGYKLSDQITVHYQDDFALQISLAGVDKLFNFNS